MQPNFIREHHTRSEIYLNRGVFLDKQTRTQIVTELMGQASEYRAVGKNDEALAIYERIVKRTEYSDEGAITELAQLYSKEKCKELYKKAALYALVRFDKNVFVKYCKLLEEDLFFNIACRDQEVLEATLEDERISVELEELIIDSSKEEQIEFENKAVIAENFASPLEPNENPELSICKKSEGKIKKKKSLPTMTDIADVLQSGGIEQALYMLDKLEAEEGQVRDLWYLRALCYVSNRDMKTAQSAIETELALYPNNDKAKRLAVDIGRVVGKRGE